LCVYVIEQMSRRNGAHSSLLISIAAFVSVHIGFYTGQGLMCCFPVSPDTVFHPFTLSWQMLEIASDSILHS